MRPGVGPGGVIGSGIPNACQSIEGLVQSYPEAKVWFLGDGGVLVLLEILDSDNEENAKAAIALMASITREDHRLLGRYKSLLEP